MCHQWTGIFFFNLVSGPALITEPTGSILDLNHSTSVEKKASTSQDINEAQNLKVARDVFVQLRFVT